MAVHLVLRLEAPFASAGGIAGEEIRPTGAAPTRSMVLGLIGNALGLDRTRADDMRRLDRLQAGTNFATVVLSEPGRWADVQNNRTPSDRLRVLQEGGSERAGDAVARLEAGGRISDHPLAYGIGPRRDTERVFDLLHKAPRQRTKHYMTGFRALAALSPTEDGWPEEASGLADALRRPARALWIGRKSCPPSAPVCLLKPLFEAESGPAALLQAAAAEMTQETRSHADATDRPAVLWWESIPTPGSKAAAGLGISGGYPTSVLDRRDWVRGQHDASSTLWRGTLVIPAQTKGASRE